MYSNKIKNISVRILSIILSAVMAFSAVGCGNNTGESETTSSTELVQTMDEQETDINQDETEDEVKKKAEEEEAAKKKAEEEEAAKKKAEEEEAAKKKAEEEEAAKKKAEEEEAAKKKAEEEEAAKKKAEEEEAAKKKAEEEEAAKKKAEEEEAAKKKAEEEEAAKKKAEEEEAKKKVQVEVLNNEDNKPEINQTQLNSINMLNYMTATTQRINASKGDQLFLQAIRKSLFDDTVLSSVDSQTQAQITQLAGTIDEYSMVNVKRERIQYLYEQEKARALRSAIPNPVGLLSAVQSQDKKKLIISLIYMTIDSALKVENAQNQAQKEFIQEGWELDDKERKALEASTTSQFNYMCNIARNYDLPDSYIVRDGEVKDFVDWSSKPLVGKIDWYEDNEGTYQKFGPYWLELVKDYYEHGDYAKCIDAIDKYEKLSIHVTEKDYEYAYVLPMVIYSLKETKRNNAYVEATRKYCKAIWDNTKDQDWELRYFAAQTYIDLYHTTQDKSDLKEAYTIAKYNVNTLVDQQLKMNNEYMSPLTLAEKTKDMTKRKKKEVDQYNKYLKAERKIGLPPVNEALYLNCDLLFALIDQVGVTKKDRERLEERLHSDGKPLFMTVTVDNEYSLNPNIIDVSSLDITFDGKEIIMPVQLVSNMSNVMVKVERSGETFEINKWEVDSVDRPKNASIEEFTVKYVSDETKKFEYVPGDKISIVITPVDVKKTKTFTIKFDAVSVKQAFVFNGISFERKN